MAWVMLAVQVIGHAAWFGLGRCWGRDIGRQDVLGGDYP